MSVDAHELERVTLLKKDRDQLQTIATALGHKAGSRARKDQLIDLILAGPPTPRAIAVATPPPAVAEANPDTVVPPAQVPASARNTARRGRSTLATTAAAIPTPTLFPAPEGSVFRPEPSLEDPAPVPNEFARNATQSPPVLDSAVAAQDSQPEAHVEVGTPSPPREPSPPQAPSDDNFGFSDDVDGDSGDEPGTSDQERADSNPNGQPLADGEGASRRRRRRGRDKERRGGELPGEGAASVGALPPKEALAPRVLQPVREQGQRDQVGRDQPRMVEQTSRDQGQREQGQREQGRDNVRNDRDRDRPERVGNDDQPSGEAVAVTGFLDLREEGYGFLRLRGFLSSKDDVYVPSKFVRQYNLRRGDHVIGVSRAAGRGEKNPALLRIDTINGNEPDAARLRRRFEDLTPLFPTAKLRLEQSDDPTNLIGRIVDLIAPIGKGQRGLIVSPPKAGRTTILKQIAQAIESNNPEVRLIVLLLDERPEEVTDIRRSLRGEVVASTFDRPAEEHTVIAELTIERAKRMVEQGEDVVIILDGLTRLARAYNAASPAAGRAVSGGIDNGALYQPKKFFGAARNTEEGGSLTILATILVDTGSRTDEVIFEELRGTANMELRLDRGLADQRIQPAIDVEASSTRHEELLFKDGQLSQVWALRRELSDTQGGNALRLLAERMAAFSTNDGFLATVGSTV